MKRLFAGLMAASLTLGITACTPAVTSSSGAASSAGSTAGVASSAAGAEDSFDWKNVTVGYTGYNNTSEYLMTVENALKESVESRGGTFLTTICNGDGQTIKSAQESFILQGADILVDFNFLTEMFDAGYSAELANKGVPVISIDTMYQEPAYYYGANIWDQGQACADAAIEYINNEWGGQCDAMVIMYLGAAGESGNQRSYGAEARFKEAFPDVETVWMDLSAGGGDQASLAYSYAADYMTGNPDKNHVYFQIHSDSQAVSAFSAIQQAGAMDRCIICSVDAQTEAVETIKKNEGKCWIATVAAHPEKYGEGLCEYIEEILTDSSTEHQRYTEAVYVNIDNIYEHFPD